MNTPALLDYESSAHPLASAARYRLIGAATFAAMLMYLDRMCLSQMVNASSAFLLSGFAARGIRADVKIQPAPAKS